MSDHGRQGSDGARTTETPAGRCRACGERHTTAKGMIGSNAGAPVPNDIVICLNCGELSRFDADMKHQVVDALEEAAFDPWLREQVAAARWAIREMSGGPT